MIARKRTSKITSEFKVNHFMKLGTGQHSEKQVLRYFVDSLVLYHRFIFLVCVFLGNIEFCVSFHSNKNEFLWFVGTRKRDEKC